MAIISEIVDDKRSIRVNPTMVEGAIGTVHRENGEVLVNLTTFGSGLRKNQGTPSQSMQFTEDIAKELCDYFAKAFGW